MLSLLLLLLNYNSKSNTNEQDADDEKIVAQRKIDEKRIKCKKNITIDLVK